MSYAAETPYLPQKPSSQVGSGEPADNQPPIPPLYPVNAEVDAIVSSLGRFAARLNQFKEQRPFQLLAIIAGVAFALGATLRIWKERS